MVREMRRAEHSMVLDNDEGVFKLDNDCRKRQRYREEVLNVQMVIDVEAVGVYQKYPPSGTQPAPIK